MISPSQAKHILILFALSITVAGCGKPEAPTPDPDPFLDAIIRRLEQEIEADAKERVPFAPAEALVADEQWEAALAEYDGIVESHPLCSEAWIGRARVLVALDRPDDAIESLDEAIKIDLSSERALFARACIYAGRGEFDKSHSDLTGTIGTASADRPMWLASAVASLLRDRPEEARHELEVTPLSDCGDLFELPIQVLRARIYSAASDGDLRNGKLALEHAQEAKRLAGDRKIGKVFDVMAMAHAELGDFQNAIASEEKAIEVADESEVDKFTKRLELYRSGKPSRASGPELAWGFRFW